MKVPAMVTNPERRFGEDQDGSSDTDPEMPELIPVSRVVGFESAVVQDVSQSCMPRSLLCQSPVITLGFHSTSKPGVELGTVSDREAAGRVVSDDASMTGPDSSSVSGGPRAPPRFTKTGSTSFGARADALAAALDNLMPSVCPCDVPTIEDVDSGPSAVDLDVPVSVECRAATSDDFDAELAGVQQGLDEDTDSGSEAADSDAELGGDGAARADMVSGRRVRARSASAVPRGAPGVAPASTTVQSAVAWARRTANEYSAAQEDDEETAEASFGPRFKGLAPEDLTAVKSSWTLHSLANVRCPSTRESKLAAASLFDALSRRQTARGAPTSQPNEDGGASNANKDQKVSFRRPAAHAVEHQQLNQTIRGDDSNPGVRVMQECIAGSRKRKAETHERAGLPHSGRMDRKRPARAICADM